MKSLKITISLCNYRFTEVCHEITKSIQNIFPERFNEIWGVGTLDLNNWRYRNCRNCVPLRPVSSDVVCALLTQPCLWYRPPDVQHSVTVPSQWLQHVRGTACRRLSGMHRRWRRSVASWRLYFSVVVRQWLGDRDCTAQYKCCLPATTDCWRFCCFVFLFFSFFLFNFIRCPCNVFDVIVSP